MKSIISITLFAFLLGSTAYGQFIKNDGQLLDFNGEVRQDILFYKNGGNVDYYFTEKGITYIYKKSAFEVDDKLTEREKYSEFLKDSMYYFRVDMNFDNSGVSTKISGKNKLEDYNNYYQAHCPNGILNVSKYSGVFYENIYENINAHFYFKDGNLKYDLILKPGANLSEIALNFNGIEDLELNDNVLEIPTDIGLIKETLPRSYEVQGDREVDVKVDYILQGSVVKFNADYNKENEFVIDPQVVWQTLYEQSFGIGNSNSMDSKGNLLVNTGYTFSTAYPVLDPGGGAYFQNANAGSGDIRIVLFDTSGARIWSTYYGGSDYENTSDIVVDYNDRIVLSFATESPDIPTQNAGGYFDGTYTAGTYNWASAFIVRFSASGVRDWATHYDHFQTPLIDVDLNNNYIVVGQSQYDNPSVQSLGGAYNQSTVSLNASGSSSSGDFFIAKFNSSTSRVWATNLGGTSREMIGKIVVDGNNNFYIWGAGDNYYGNGIITQNAGGYFDNALGTGTGGTATDRGDCLLYKFSPGGALLWGTAFGGSGLEWAWGSQADVSVDQNNNVYVACNTRSTDIPVLNMGGGAYYDGTFSNPSGSANPHNHFVARFNPSTQLEWCTYWGDYSYSHATSHGVEIEFNNDNQMTIAVGVGNGDYYPLLSKPGSYNQNYMSGDVHIAQFDNAFALDWATYYGGSSGERLGDMVFAENSNSFFMCNSWFASSGALWVTPPSGAYYNGTHDGNSEHLISKFSPIVCPTASNTTSTATICESATKPLVGSPSGGTWSISSGGGSISGTTYTPANVSTATSVTVTYTIPAASGCPLTSDDVTFTVNAESTAPTSITGTASICTGNSTTLTVSGGSAGTGATAQWYSGSCGGTSVGSGNSITVSPTSTTTYYVRYEGSCNTTTCVSQTVTVNTNSTAPTGISGTTTICSGTPTTLTLSGGSAGTGATAQWYSGSCGGTPVGSGNSVTVSPTSTTTYYVRYEGTCNTTACASQAVTVNAVPAAPTASASPSAICPGDNATLSTTGCSGTVEWYTNSGGTGTPLASTTVSPASTTTYYAFCTESGCRSATGGSVTLTVNSNPTVTVPNGGNVCEGGTLSLSPSTGGTWSSSDPTVASITNGGVVTGESVGTAEMTFTNTSTGCSSTSSAGTITVNPLPTFTVSTTDPSACGATDGTITISGLNASTGYEVSTGSGALSPETSNASGEIILTGLGSGSYSPIEVSLNNCSTVDNGTYDLNDPSSPTITVPNGGVVCEGDTLNVSPTTGGTWSSNDPSVVSITNGGVLVGESAGTATVTYTETATGCSSLASAGSITVNPTPTVTVPNGGNVCEGATLDLTPSTGGTWSSSDPTVASITNGGVVTGESAGTAEMTFTNTTTGCSSVASTGTITVNTSPTITVPAGNAICEGDTLSLEPTTGGTWISNDPTVATITAGGVVTGVSQGTTAMVFTSTATGCSSIAADGTVIVNTTPTLTTGAINCDKPTSSYSVEYTTDVGATVTASVGTVTSTAVTGVPNDQEVIITSTAAGCPSVQETVSTDECDDVVVDVSNGVSPNNDGMNDFLEITNLEAYPENSLTIYNRWGDKVYQSSPYENDWIGQNNVGGLGGEDLPAGTYFYVLELGEDQEPIKGYIELKK